MLNLSALNIEKLGNELYMALLSGATIDPITDRIPDITIEEAYRVQQQLMLHREQAGEKIIGKKIGVTSKAVMKMLGVDQPDFGMLTDAMLFQDGDSIPFKNLIQPKAEGEIAFRMKKDLKGPGVTPQDVLEATEGVMACFEVVDSRIRDWKIKIQDTVADNASCGVFVLGQQMIDPKELDLLNCSMTLAKNGVDVVSGKGSATMGSPLVAMAWLANTLGELGIPLKAGEVVLSGALGAMVPIVAGDRLSLKIDGLGGCEVRFV